MIFVEPENDYYYPDDEDEERRHRLAKVIAYDLDDRYEQTYRLLALKDCDATVGTDMKETSSASHHAKEAGARLGCVYVLKGGVVYNEGPLVPSDDESLDRRETRVDL